jgi:hypothetical protein
MVAVEVLSFHSFLSPLHFPSIPIHTCC